MIKRMFRFLLWRWCQLARRLYGGPGERGELFNTACFQDAVSRSIGWEPSSATARDLLFAAGYYAKKNSSYWFDKVSTIETLVTLSHKESFSPEDSCEHKINTDDA